MAKAEMGLGRSRRAVGAFDIRDTGACGLQASRFRTAGFWAVGARGRRVLRSLSGRGFLGGRVCDSPDVLGWTRRDGGIRHVRQPCRVGFLPLRRFAVPCLFVAKVPGKALVPFCPCRMCFGHFDSHIMHGFPYRMDMLGIVCSLVVAKTVARSSYDETDDFGGVGCWSGLGHFGGQDGFHQRTPFHIGTFMGTGAGTAFCRIWPRRFPAGVYAPASRLLQGACR